MCVIMILLGNTKGSDTMKIKTKDYLCRMESIAYGYPYDEHVEEYEIEKGYLPKEFVIKEIDWQLECIRKNHLDELKDKAYNFGLDKEDQQDYDNFKKEEREFEQYKKELNSKYILFCPSCGYKWFRNKKTKTITEANNYTCGLCKNEGLEVIDNA